MDGLDDSDRDVRAAAPEIGPVATPRWAGVAAVLAAAFTDDPVFEWLLPDPARRPAALGRFFAVEARRIVLPHGRSVRADDAGVMVGTALVAPPGAWRTPLSVEARYGPQYVRAFGSGIARALRLLTHLERRHAVHAGDPHVYFPYIGVVPDAQGRGVGGAMVSSVLRDCDRTGTPAYLEASNPSCARLYERLGFVGVDDVDHRGCPTIRLMRRDPA